MRRVFVGDVQGCREELERLLEAVGFDPAGDELHPVGDLVNRGPDNVGVLRLLSSLEAGGVLGNHDLHLLATECGARALRPRDTIQDVLAVEDREELVAWLAERPFLRLWDDVLLVHAGLHPRWDDPAAVLGAEDPLEPGAAASFAVSVRTCDAGGERPPDDREDARFRPWWEFWPPGRRGGRTAVFGHWSVRGLVAEPGLRGLDTGCVWGRELTAWIAEEDRVVQVPARRAYAPVD